MHTDNIKNNLSICEKRRDKLSNTRPRVSVSKYTFFYVASNKNNTTTPYIFLH